MSPSPRVVQAWIEPKADDPEAASARTVARSRLAAGATLTELRRARLIEITGTSRGPAELAELLHASTQFYNPHKERCAIRTAATDPSPHAANAGVVVVWERDGERRPAAERWWRHETGETVEVREGVAWVVVCGAGEESAEVARELACVRDVRHGLLCNPWSQIWTAGHAPEAIPWIRPAAPPGGEP